MLVGRAIFKLYELPEPFGEAGAAEAGGVESVENGAPSKPTQGDSTAALLKKVLYRLSNLEQDNQVVKKENQVILKDNRVLKERVDIIEQENRGLKEENRGLKEEIQAQKKRIDGLQKDLNASNTRCDLLEKQQRESETKYSKMEAAHCELANDHRNLKNDHNGLVADHRQLEMKMRSLHRRSLLDQARNELLFTTRLNRQDYENKPQALLAAVKQALPAGVDLSDLALQSIFLTGEIRAKGNIVAHEATQDEVAHAVLGSENTTAVRKVLREIYKYVYKTEPKLDLFV
ncbi:hypothetical protein H0H92_014958 [Tricholoma furcatifolium]|nr:hypothetical protein H0H92_014958 [Tricholoma furcatifolium]